MKKNKKVVELVTKKIGLHLDSIEDGFSKFSYKENYILSSEVIDYIERNAKTMLGIDLLGYEIDIYCPNEISKATQELFISSYMKHYAQTKTVGHKAVKRTKRISLLLFIASAIILVGMHSIAVFWPNAPQIINFTLEIASWVFMWEAVDQFFFTRNKEMLDIAFYDKLDDAKITFIKEENKDLLD